MDWQYSLAKDFQCQWVKLKTNSWSCPRSILTTTSTSRRLIGVDCQALHTIIRTNGKKSGLQIKKIKNIKKSNSNLSQLSCILSIHIILRIEIKVRSGGRLFWRSQPQFQCLLYYYSYVIIPRKSSIRYTIRSQESRVLSSLLIPKGLMLSSLTLSV
jgi:hypothetical protein